MSRAALLLLMLSACSTADEYECTFDYLPDTYTTSHWQVAREGELIFVQRDGRDFAFSRDSIKLCRKVVPSHAEGLTPGA